MKVTSSLFYCALFFVLAFLLMFASVQAYSDENTTTLNGVVYDKYSGEVLSGASITLSRDSVGFPKGRAGGAAFRTAQTNAFGFYSFERLQPGAYTLTVRFQRYQPFTVQIMIADSSVSMRQNVYLTPYTARSNALLVEGQSYSQKDRLISSVELTQQMLRTVPATFGEADITKTLQLIPGIKSSSEASSGLYIRGGSPDQNLVLLDGIPVYNPMHLGGIFSTFNSDALGDVRVIKGVFPAEYGGRLSGVVDVSMRDGTREKISGNVNVGLIASRILLEGPITDNATFMLSARRTYFELPIAAIKAVTTTPELPQYYFYDLNAKVSVALSENDKLVASAYTGGDVFLYTSADTTLRGNLAWGNTIANIRWTHIFSPSVFTNDWC